MTSYERTMAAMSFKTPDRIPRYDWFWSETEVMYRTEMNLSTDTVLTDYFGVDLCVAAANEEPFRRVEVSRNGDEHIFRNGWGSLVRECRGVQGSEVLEPAIQSYADLDKPFVPANDPERYKRFQQLVAQEKSNGKAVFGKIGGIFIRSCFMRGQENLLMDLLADREFAQAVVEKVADHLLQVALESLAVGDLYDTGIWIYDDMAYNEGPLYSPSLFADVFMPLYARLIGAIKSAGAKYVVFHSDGNILPVLDMLLEVGVDGINPVEPKAGMSVPALRRKYGDRLVLIGGMCNSQILPNGPIAAIEEQARDIIACGRDGGVIIGAHSIGPDIPAAHYLAYDKTVRTEGRFLP